MSALDDLLARIDDAQLREDIVREVAPLRAEQELGLVFERHLPERARLYGHPVRRGLLVQMRAEDDGDTWQVTKVSKGVASLRRAHDGETLTCDAPVDALVVVRDFGTPIYPGLRSEGTVERGEDKPWHVAINGENYHALEALLYTCEGQVDAIYIDPPYNTGAKDWKYNNDYVSSEDGYRHSKWLSFMEKRLLLAKRLLNPNNSVLIVTIDEKEYLRLGLLLEQVFPGQRRQMVTSVIAPAGQARGREFARVEEYLFVVYSGDAGVTPTADAMLGTLDPDDDATESPQPVPWENLLRRGTSARRQDRPKQFFPIFIDEGGTKVVSVGHPLPDLGTERETVAAPTGTTAVWPLRSDGSEGRWRVGRDGVVSLLDDGFLRLGQQNKTRGTWAINYRLRSDIARIESGEIEVVGRSPEGYALLQRVSSTVSTNFPKSVWNRDSHNAGNHGTALLRSLIPGRSFPFPKSLYAVEDVLRFFVGNRPDALVVDFFGGSGTTTHAVARLNHQDGGRRRSIVVSNNEVSPEEAKAMRDAGHLPGDPEWEAQGIFENITAPRIRAAFTGRTPDGEPVKGDYKFTDEFPMADGFDENVEFFTLTYEDPDAVRAGAAFASIAPLLWLKAGAEGPRVDSDADDWALPDGGRYGVLFHIDEWPAFTAAINEAVDSGRTLTHAFIVTNSDAQFQQVAADLPPEVAPVRLFEDYLTSFAINTGGAS